MSDDFFKKHDICDHGEGLFDHMSGFLYFVKDREYRFVAVNERLVGSLGAGDASEVIGKTDHDFFPAPMADAFMKDDSRIFETGEPLRNKIELVPRGEGTVDWSTTTKIPLRSTDGAIKAIAGVTRPFAAGISALSVDSEFGETIALMKENLANNLKVADLARNAGMSRGTFGRKFKKYFHMSPCEYIRHLRVHASCYLVSHTNKPLAEIAAECGFSDQPHMSREFSRIIKKTPLAYRKIYQTH